MYCCRELVLFSCLTVIAVGNATASARFQNTKVQPPSNLFRRLVLSKCPNVDKSLLIIDVIEGPPAVCISRPRSFGKTTNLLMLREFFRCDKNTTHFFKDLQIMDPKYRTIREKHMNKYPVVYVDFRIFNRIDPNQNDPVSFSDSFNKLFRQYGYLKASEKLTEQQKKSILQFKSESKTDCFSSIQYLCELLTLHHGVAPILLIDEVDAPLIEAKMSGIYEQVSEAIHRILLLSLDLNEYYFKAITCSVLPVFNDVRFVKLGRIVKDSSLNPLFKSHFGFTEDNVKHLMRDYRKEEGNKLTLKTLSEWYNGYKVGTETLFNTASVSECLSAGGKLRSYQNVFSGSLGKWLEKLLLNHGSLPALNIQCLCRNITIKKCFRPESFQLTKMIRFSETNLWNMLYYAGLITYDGSLKRENRYQVDLKCPNKEIKDLLLWKVIEPLVDAKMITDYDTFSKQVYERDKVFVLEWMKKYVIGARGYMTAEGGNKPTLKNLVDYINLLFRGFQKIYGVNSTTTYKGRVATTVFMNTTAPKQILLQVEVEVEPGTLKKVRHFFTRPDGFNFRIQFLGNVYTKIKFIR